MKKIIIASLLTAFSSVTMAADKTDKVVLTIKNGSIVKEIKDSDLKKLKWTSFSSSTPWFASVQKFNGPLLKDVLTLANIKQTDNITVTALDKYQINIPASDAWKEPVILTREINDKPLKIKDKGPTWIVYNFDSKPSLKTDMYYSRSPWSIATIEKK